jgi:hypothetical protein
MVVRRPEPDLDGKSPVELLALTAALPGNLRYLATPEGVLLLGEARGPDDARQRLDRLLHGGPPEPGTAVSEEALEAALLASGFAWSRRETGWAVPVGEHLPRELQITAGPAGVRVEATLAEWDEVGDKERRALARFLLAAQAGLRLARCELDQRRARIVSAVDGDLVDAELAHALMGVAAGCRLLAREAAALLAPEVARAYLEFHEAL